MSLQTGQKITRYNLNEIPIPQTMINWVNVLGKDQPEHFIFTDRRGRKIVESEITGVEEDQNGTPYCQVHENEGPRNSDKTRTQGAICLGPCGNLHGGFKFMSLKTGQKITKYNWVSTSRL